MKSKINILVIVLFVVLNLATEVRPSHSHGFLYPPPLKYAEGPLPPDLWFNQKLDHSDPVSTETWKQRYFFDTRNYRQGGPIFLMIGGEGPASAIWMTTGSWYNYAKQFGAAMFQLEHRFYGKSHPTKDVTVDSLKYLTTENALADLAYFVTTMKEAQNFTSNKWVTFGGSYPGTLSAWFRLKYPHLVHAAVSSSAPIVAQTNFKEYLEVVDAALSTSRVGTRCNAAVKKATRTLEMFLTHVKGWSLIEKKFRLCKPMDGMNQLDVDNLHATLAGNFEGVVQYNRDNRAFEGAKGTDITIDTLCNIMTNTSIKFEIDRYAVINSLMLDTYEMKCLNHTYADFINDLRTIEWNDEDIGGRAWTYQTCTEYGFYQGSDSSKHPFGNHFTTKFYVQQCKDIFGPKFDAALVERGVKRTNILYGGRNLKVKRVVFINGSIDPWHALGITKSNSTDAPAIFIQGTAHCANMYPAAHNDLPQLKSARDQVGILLKKWLKEK